MRIIDRYICREVLSHALLGLVVFTFVLFVPQLVRLMELVVRHATDAPSILLLFLCTLPGVFTFTLPIASLVGVLIGLGRMSADSEIIALHALGIGQRRMLWPVGLLAIATALLTATMTFWLGPQALRTFRAIELRLRSTQASFEIQPRVFDERFPRYVLYVQDVDATSTRWRGVILAESDTENGSRLTLAEEAIVIADRQQGKLQIHLRNGSTHEYNPKEPERYSVSTFGQSDVPIPVSELSSAIAVRRTNAEFSLSELLRVSGPAAGDVREARVEFHRRFAFPAACLVFALLATPLAARPRRGGRAGAFLLTLLLICGYYLLFVFGVGLARRGTIPVWLGIWAANFVAAMIGLSILPRMEQPGEGVLGRWAETMASLRHRWRPRKLAENLPAPSQETTKGRASEKAVPPGSADSTDSLPAPRLAYDGLPLLLDLYLLRHFFFYFVIMTVGFLLLFHAFTFFELLNDIARHSVPFLVVFDYFRFLTPHLFYLLLPLSVLVASVVTVTVLSKTNEIVAFKAAGVSLYRLSAPLLMAATVLAGVMLLLDYAYLPFTNQQQDALRNQIKGRPAKTFFQPRRQWIFGEGGRLYNYDLIAPDGQQFGGLSVFQLDAQTFQLRERTYAARGRWDDEQRVWELENGWVRKFEGASMLGFSKFAALAPRELAEPPSYFIREVRPYYQMNWQELSHYVRDLQQAGFDVSRLSVQWHRKFAYPLMAPIIVLLAIPFAARAGARGFVVGVALAVAIGIAYWFTSDLFVALGSVGQLPPFLAAWAPDAIFVFVGAYLFLKVPT